jgi:hypothetical protein
MRPADLGVCAPSGTRTPNPLKTGPHIVAVVALPLMLARPARLPSVDRSRLGTVSRPLARMGVA